MPLSFNPQFERFGQYLAQALHQASHYDSLGALMDDLQRKEISHGDILEQGISSPLVVLAHVINNPHMVNQDTAKGNVSGDIAMLLRGANDAVNMAPIDAVPVAAVEVLGRAFELGELSPVQRYTGAILVGLMDRSQHLEPEHRESLQKSIATAFKSYRQTYPLDANDERKLAGFLHGESAKKLVTHLGFKPSNIRFLSTADRRSLSRSEAECHA